jgi:hypothetical protein
MYCRAHDAARHTPYPISGSAQSNTALYFPDSFAGQSRFHSSLEADGSGEKIAVGRTAKAAALAAVELRNSRRDMLIDSSGNVGGWIQ